MLFVLALKSKLTGQEGRGSRPMTESEARTWVQRLDREFPDVAHRAEPIAEPATNQEAEMIETAIQRAVRESLETLLAELNAGQEPSDPALNEIVRRHVASRLS